ncbi:Short-chain dehydrogenase TIC 32- chloroplastic [Apiospora rasikravindrae]|uniref:Short-chain dehydrogenase TIC 32- chloroplastic n=1 Tax=Apiospora rasikravindrae TaxID=990691 RepID=A0ABR1TA28_9PEZI
MVASKGSVVLTGASGSLGRAIVSGMLASAEFSTYHGIYTVRDTSTATALRNILQPKTPSHSHKHDVMALDLSIQASVRDFATNLNAAVAAGDVPPIRVLILNAGWEEFTTQTWTDDGFDMTFMANYLGHWLLTMLLIQSMDRESGKIVVVGSLAHDPYAQQNNSGGQFSDPKWKMIFQDSIEPVAKGTWSTSEDDPSWCAGFRRYGASKMCEIMMIPELQRRLDADPTLNRISVLGVDPGSMPSNLTRRGPWAIRVLLGKIIMPLFASLVVRLSPNGPLRTTHKSARDILNAGFEPSPVKGLYYDGSARSEMCAEAREPAKQSLLWRESVEYTQLRSNETALKMYA